ncbi:ATP-binding protein [Lacimicrobium alkaliphilum]|uniref:ATP-binding protein n=1 Tax=Lacimicrobium alkaliphilum TaxID=1526571 RepID=UPI001E435A33|nr:ATP-binding protein [Lacimicrobium alkaliphilum]
MIFFAATQSYRNTINASAMLFDRHLHSLADTLNSLPIGTIDKTANARSMVSPEDNFIFQVWHQNNMLLSSPGLEKIPFTALKEGVREENIQGLRWQVLAHFYPQTGYWVMVAEPLHHRVELSEEMVLATLVPLVLSLPILAVLISVAIKQGLAPLHQLAKELQTKRADDLSALQLRDQKKELKPVVETINNLLARLDLAFARERRFASDAAHELRTPLSVLRLNAHNLEKELDSGSENLLLLKQGVERMSHVVDQILLLNRTNPEHFSVKFEKVDLYKIIQQVITELYPQIAQKQQHISLQGQSCMMQGDDFSLRLLVQNLLTNANKYSPVHGQIEVSLNQNGERLELMVEDSGPGLNEQEYERVFDRFYRVGGDRHPSGVPGCGLGLAIVRHVLSLYHGHIYLGRSQRLGGLAARVVIPCGGMNA